MFPGSPHEPQKPNTESHTLLSAFFFFFFAVPALLSSTTLQHTQTIHLSLSTFFPSYSCCFFFLAFLCSSTLHWNHKLFQAAATTTTTNQSNLVEHSRVVHDPNQNALMEDSDEDSSPLASSLKANPPYNGFSIPNNYLGLSIHL